VGGRKRSLLWMQRTLEEIVTPDLEEALEIDWWEIFLGTGFYRRAAFARLGLWIRGNLKEAGEGKIWLAAV